MSKAKITANQHSPISTRPVIKDIDNNSEGTCVLLRGDPWG